MSMLHCKRRTLGASPEKRSQAVEVTRSRTEPRTKAKTRACGYPPTAQIATAWHARCAVHRHAKRVADVRRPRGDVLFGPARSLAGGRRARQRGGERGRTGPKPRDVSRPPTAA